MFESEPRIIEPRSLVWDVVEVLTREIQTGEIPPGERMMPGRLAKRLDVSQTPIREALRTLEMQGLVTIDRRSTYAAELSAESVLDLYRLRGLIECDAARISVTNQTQHHINLAEEAYNRLQFEAAHPYSEKFWTAHRDFHWSIYQSGSKSDWTKRLLNMIWREVERYVTISIRTSGNFSTSEHFDIAMNEHSEIFNRFAASDADGLVEVIDRHLLRTAQSVEQSLQERKTLKADF